ncbi:9258_t:CDS:2 [Ambispora gerdemannii]|uniref:9258_t:CDS:1 n=1 Tax=Ambispora gerdemannii TaxID=144530 RepID=A0A9N9A800_9GLOM|nr:9258_t:CDS:2 [Ambispora gerdemannii]
MPSPVWTAACLGKDNTIYIFGGTDASQTNLPKVNTLYKIKPSISDDVSLDWIASSPNLADTWPSARDGIFPIIDNHSRIFVWGGRNEGQDNKTMYIYEENKWTSYNLNNAPNPRASYSATLLNDGRIIYIGGASSSPYPDVNFSELSTSNKSLRNRRGHSALLHMDTISIIVYGGDYDHDEEIPISDSVCTLNTKNWEWSQQSVSSLPYITVTRGHTAVLYNGYMIIAFGVNGNYSYTSEVKVMDVANLSSLAWVPTYKVRTLPPTTTGPTNVHITSSTTSSTGSTTTIIGTEKKNNIGLILGVTISGIIGGGLATIAFIFFLRRRKSGSPTTTLATILPNGGHSEYSHSNNEPVSADLSTLSASGFTTPVSQYNFPVQQTVPQPNPSYQQYNPHLSYLYDPNPLSHQQYYDDPNSPLYQQYNQNSSSYQQYNPNLPAANQYPSNLAEI